MFTRARKCLDDGKDLNTLFDSPMDNVLKIRENFKAKYKDDYNSENGSEHFSIKKQEIVEESKERLDEARFCAEIYLAKNLYY